MGNKINEKKYNSIINENDYNNYHCSKCGEIPLLILKGMEFDMFCESHKILNIPIEQLNEFINFSFNCSFCKSAKSEKNNDFVVYCYECDKYYCKKCIHNNKKNRSHNNNHFTVEANLKNNICKEHKQLFKNYCFDCRKNICDFCKVHENHNKSLLKELLPSVKYIDEFNKEIQELYAKNSNKYYTTEYKKNLLNSIFIQEALINYSFRNIKNNYNYINNIRNNLNVAQKEKITQPFKNNKLISRKLEHCSITDNENVEDKKIIYSNKNNFHFSSVYCVLLLNPIIYEEKNKAVKLELIAIGGEGQEEIVFINLINSKIHQKVNSREGFVISLTQFEKDCIYLFSSTFKGNIDIFKLNDNNKNYYLIKSLKKSINKDGNEINKVITLTNKLLVSGDHRSITIWKKKEMEKNLINDNKINDANKSINKEINYEDYFEIVINQDTCHLLEVNSNIFAAAQYSNGGKIQVYKNDGKNFPLLAELINIESQGINSNGLSKINDELFCSGGEKGFIYIIGVNPIQLIQKISVSSQNKTITFVSFTKNGYIYCQEDYGFVVQFKVIKDENNNFVELEEYGKIKEKRFFYPLDDGRIIIIDDGMNNEFHLLI